MRKKHTLDSLLKIFSHLKDIPMAPKFKKRSIRKKAPAKRAARQARRSGPVRLPGTLAPQHMLTQLKYVSNFQKQLTTGGNIQKVNQYRLNSVWDPDIDNTTGSSCLGITQWRALYQRYRVYKLDYSVRLTNLTPDTVLTGALVPANYSDSSFTIGDFMRPLARRFELGNNQGQNRTVVRGSIYLPKLMGVTPAQYKADENTLAGWGANPVAPLNMAVLIQSTNTASVPVVGVQIEFTYYIEMMALDGSAEAVDHGLSPSS